ncbi:hypothetical protein N825_08595 [Skermanella stibiiresistens SB22]|uniref:Metal-dependent protein hydrolase n=1 Tax=Skermanella stibiiresistens SB22 TaxID=1385369 RepID=W9H2M5_9PROT|nr:MYG1 family protein [Skermanella stibiiresistens]EWY39051.1 hypothetical protein N825_08595 [Skermanella stibiiresistens SB22]
MATILALTHSGYFHADEVTAYAILRLGDENVAASFKRSRDPTLISQAAIVFDVGGVHDPSQGRYDHHMTVDRAPKRDDGRLYSSAGLIWRDFGRAALRGMAAGPDDKGIPADGVTTHLDELWARIDHVFIRRIDGVDTGEEPAPPLSYADQIDAFNPNWTEEIDADRRFLEAAGFAADTLRRLVRRELAHILSRDIVLEAHASSADPRVLELPGSLPWQGVVQDHGLPVVYAIYHKDGDWMITAMPTSAGGHDQRVPLPRAWAGLRDADIQKTSGVEDAVFAHAARFCGAAGSKAGALEMARKALELAGHPPPTMVQS